MKLKQRHSQETIQEYLQSKMKKSNTFVLKVTKTCYYVVNSQFYEDKKQELISDWFETDSPSAPKVDRDNSLYYESFDELEEIEKEDGEINIMDLL